MKIYFAGQLLSDWDAFPAQQVSVNGATVVEAVDIVRAAAKRFFHRGNDSLALQFSARREFATHREAQVFLLSHYSRLPKFGLCQIVCGAPGEVEQSVYFLNAVLAAMPQGGFSGVSVELQYMVQAGGPPLLALPGDFYLGSEDMILRSKQAIAAAAESVAVVFSQAFAPGTAVIVTANVAKPSAAAGNIFATVREDLVTVNGFTVELSAPTPDATYKLHWTAYGP